jgi:hypothetical protein
LFCRRIAWSTPVSAAAIALLRSWSRALPRCELTEETIAAVAKPSPTTSTSSVVGIAIPRSEANAERMRVEMKAGARTVLPWAHRRRLRRT